MPQSFNVLLQLPHSQLAEALHEVPEMQIRLMSHINELTESQVCTCIHTYTYSFFPHMGEVACPKMGSTNPSFTCIAFIHVKILTPISSNKSLVRPSCNSRLAFLCIRIHLYYSTVSFSEQMFSFLT